MSQCKVCRKLVVFSGLDGAGKSTQIELLVRRLRDEGYKVGQIWARGGYTPGMSLLKRLARRIRPGILPAPGRSAGRDQQFRSFRVRRLWLMLAILDLIIYYGLWVRLLKVAGRVVVSDRYVADTLIDFQLNFPQEHVEGWRLWRCLVLIAPPPDHTFVLVVPVAESARRGRLKSEPFPDSAEVLRQRLKIYQEMGVGGGCRLLDGVRPRENLHVEISRCCGLES